MQNINGIIVRRDDQSDEIFEVFIPDINTNSKVVLFRHGENGAWQMLATVTFEGMPSESKVSQIIPAKKGLPIVLGMTNAEAKKAFNGTIFVSDKPWKDPIPGFGDGENERLTIFWPDKKNNKYDIHPSFCPYGEGIGGGKTIQCLGMSGIWFSGRPLVSNDTNNFLPVPDVVPEDVLKLKPSGIYRAGLDDNTIAVIWYANNQTFGIELSAVEPLYTTVYNSASRKTKYFLNKNGFDFRAKDKYVRYFMYTYGAIEGRIVQNTDGGIWTWVSIPMSVYSLVFDPTNMIQ